MNTDLIMFETDKVTIFVLKLLKQSRPEHHLDPMVLLRYPGQEIRVVGHLEQYIEKNKDLRKDQNLLISFAKPHKRITTSTISKWCVSYSKINEFLTLKSHLNERTVTEIKNYQIKQALTKCEG